MGGLESLQNWIPTNMRTYVSSLAGSQEPITAANFKPDELAFMREQLQAQAAKNQAKRAYYQQANEYAVAHAGETKEWVWDKSGKSAEKVYSKDDYLRELNSYGNPDKTAVSYDAYGGKELDGSLLSSFNSPGYNVMTTLGQYNSTKNPDGTTSIKDNYDWTKPDKLKGMSWADKMAVYGKVRSAEEFGNLTARLFRPGISRPVNVNLGKLPL
jgi:hypothetical protein